jgi:hypothetical protein
MATPDIKEWVYKLRSEITTTLGLVNFAIIFTLFLNQLGVFGIGTRISTCEVHAVEFENRITAASNRQDAFERETREQLSRTLGQYPRFEQSLAAINDRLSQLEWGAPNPGRRTKSRP